jgi:hypothetical protein
MMMMTMKRVEKALRWYSQLKIENKKECKHCESFKQLKLFLDPNNNKNTIFNSLL